MRIICPGCQKFFTTTSDNPSVRCKECELETIPKHLEFLPVHIPDSAPFETDELWYLQLTKYKNTKLGQTYSPRTMQTFLWTNPPSGIVFKVLNYSNEYLYLVSTYYNEEENVTTLVYLNTLPAAIAMEELNA